MSGRDEIFDLAQVRVGKDVAIAGGHGDESACCPVCGSGVMNEPSEPEHTTVLSRPRYDKHV
jgi:hypothetical protein